MWKLRRGLVRGILVSCLSLSRTASCFVPRGTACLKNHANAFACWLAMTAPEKRINILHADPFPFLPLPIIGCCDSYRDSYHELADTGAVILLPNRRGRAGGADIFWVSATRCLQYMLSGKLSSYHIQNENTTSGTSHSHHFQCLTAECRPSLVTPTVISSHCHFFSTALPAACPHMGQHGQRQGRPQAVQWRRNDSEKK